MKRKSSKQISSISSGRFLSFAMIVIISAQLFLVALANADVPIPIGQTVQDNPFESSPTAHTVVGTTTPLNLQNARDSSLDTSGSFGYGTTGNVEYTTFTQAPTAFSIGWVDFKISYRASGTSGSNDMYRIVYYVGSAGPVILQDWANGTGAKFDNGGAQAHRAWSMQTEPNDSAWDWTDISNVRLRVETQRVGTDDSQRVFLYEAWLSVYSGPLPPTGAVSIQPSTITGLHASDTFFMDIYATDVTKLWGYQFTIIYNTSVLTALDPMAGLGHEYFSYNPCNNKFAAQVDDVSGFVALTYTSFFGDSAGFTGNTPLARLYFVVDAEGYSVIHFDMLMLSNTVGGEILVPTHDAVFSTSAAHDVAITDIQVNPTALTPGGNVQINVTAVNQGTAPETFDVSAYYDSNLIGTQTLTSLPPSTKETLSYNWDTSGTPVGQYVIRAEASTVPSETDTGDNSYTDGTVTLQQPTESPVALFDFYLFTPSIGETVAFDASTSYTPSGTEITSYRWDFGDGNTVVYLKNVNLTSVASHSYKSPGAFVVTLEVTNDKSLSDAVSMVVTVYGGFATWLYAPIVANSSLTPGSTFSIDIGVNNIENLWGFQFLVKYNTAILTATNYAFYSPFDTALPSEINDTAGYVALARYTYLGDNEGLTTNTPKPIVRIDFSVDANGTSRIDLALEDPSLDFYGAIINTQGVTISQNVELVDGYFSNVEEVGNHDVAIMNVVVNATIIEPGDQVPIYVTVFNQGKPNEVFEINVYYDNFLIETMYGVSLRVGETKTTRFVWTTFGLAGAYSISAEARVMSDTDPADNLFVYGKVTVGIIGKARVLFDQTHGTDPISTYSNWISNLVARGYTIDTWQGGPITPGVIAAYDVFVIPQAYQPYSSSELSAIQSFVNDGGGLFIIGDDNPYIYTDLTSFAGIIWNPGGAMGGYLTDITPHPVTDGVTTVYFAAPVSYLTLTSPAQDLIRDQYGNIMLAVSEIGTGKVMGIADENTIDDWDIGYADNMRLANNIIDWFILKIEHEISVNLEAYPYMKPSDSVLLNATVRNYGLQNETSVELTLIINGAPVDSVMLTQLMVGESYTLTYLWTPPIQGIYNVTAYAPPVPNETSTSNNRATKLVTVAYPLIQPMEGQWANYSITFTETSTGRTQTMLLNATYFKYISPYQMNVTLWMTSPYGGNGTAWLILNVMTRRVEAGTWSGLWYPLWIEPNVKVGSAVNILTTIGNITGSRLVEAGDFLIDSWELQFNYYGEMYTFLFDKVTGVVTGVEGTTPYATETWKLLATNILKLLKMQIDPQKGAVGTQVTLAGEEATPNGTVEVYWEKIPIGTTLADSSGKFTFTFKIPASTRGVHRIRAIDLATQKPGVTLFEVVSSITLEPISGPIGTKLKVTGLGFAAKEKVDLSFDDMPIAQAHADDLGSFAATFSVPFSASGTHVVKAWFGDSYLETTFAVVSTDPLEVTIDVGAVYFKGETAEFYVQTALNGKPADATTVNATVYMPDGTTQKLTAQRIAGGLYKARLPLSGKGSMIGTYTLVIEVNLKSSTINAYGTSIRTFIVKSTWERESPKIAALSVASIGLVSAMALLWRKEKKKFP